MKSCRSTATINGEKLLSLRDRLKQLSMSAEGLEPEQILEEWRVAIDTLFQYVSESLKPYVTDNLLSLSRSTIECKEDMFGKYQIDSLVIRSGTEAVLMLPVGRIIAGATGRVDITRFGQGGFGYMLLRSGVFPENTKWSIIGRAPPNSLMPSQVPSLHQGEIKMKEDLSVQKLEVLLEQLFA